MKTNLDNIIETCSNVKKDEFKNTVKILQNYLNTVPDELAMLEWDIERLKDEIKDAINILQNQ